MKWESHLVEKQLVPRLSFAAPLNERLLMTSISSRKFAVGLHSESDEESSRAVRRVLVNPDILKSSRLTTGDVVAVSGTEDFKVGNIAPQDTTI